MHRLASYAMKVQRSSVKEVKKVSTTKSDHLYSVFAC